NIEALGLESAVTNVQLYPNPATDRAYLVLEHPLTNAATVTLHDVSGKMVYRKDWEADAPRQIPLNFGTANFSPGVYIVRLTQENGKQTVVERLVVSR
ncbi:MAG: T9SS type A sorting domain-containing protein, partial [Bacteroidota bacterium]